MRRLVITSLFIGFAAPVFAEQGQNPPSQGPGGPSPQRSGSAVQIWDDRVFDLGSKAEPPTTRKGASGTERYLGPDADYNSGQRNKWLSACEPMKNVDLRAYRDCFANERRKSNELTEQNRAEVSGRSALPLRNVPSPIYDSEAQRNPAYDVDIERTEEK